MKIFTLVVLTLLLSFQTIGQCPSTMTATAATTAASCPSNGTAVITTVPAANSSFSYMLTSAPAGIALNIPQASGTFNALLPGNYTALVTCGVTDATISFTITDNYTPLNVDADAAANCGTFSQSGTITITTTGGSAPLVYSVIKSNDPNYPDAQSVYTGSSIQTVTEYGTYQVRVKDACNQFYTKTIIVNSPLLPMEAHAASAEKDGCGTSTATLGVYLYDPVSGTYGSFGNYSANGGLKVRVWEQDASAGCGPTGPLLYETILTTSAVIENFPVIASKKYYVQTITACGDTSAYCQDGTGMFTPAYYSRATSKGCSGSSSNPPRMNIIDQADGFMVYPIQITIRNSSGVVVYTTTLNDYNDTYTTPDLVFDNYTVTAVDACGNTIVNSIANPSSAGVPDYSFVYYDPSACIAGGTTQTGTTSAWLSVSGYQEDFANTVITIISGPSNVGVQGAQSGDQWAWANMLPGTYVIRVTTTCGSKDYTVTANPTPGQLFYRSITAAASSTCGGGGSVTSSVTTSSNAQNFFDLIRSSTGQVVASNLNGNFVNVAAGTYYVRLGATRCDGSDYYLNSNTITIASAAGPQIVKKMGITCENGSGTPLTTGTAYLSFAGASPLLVEYKLASSSTWLTYSANAAADIAISGLTSGEVYDVRVTACGITTASQITIEQMGPISTVTPLQPCNNQSYELKLPQLSGASYLWKNSAGTVISTAFNYTIANYDNSYNGDYTGTMTWGGCINRTAEITLNSAFCGTTITLPVKLVSFNAKAEKCTAVLNWKTEMEAGTKKITIERSADGKNFFAIGEVNANGINSSYSYTDYKPGHTNYYRLRMDNYNGKHDYSKTINLLVACNEAEGEWSVFPTLVHSGSDITTRMTIGSTGSKMIRLIITNSSGQKISEQVYSAQPGSSTHVLSLKNLSAGTYIINAYDKDNSRIGQAQKFVLVK